MQTTRNALLDVAAEIFVRKGYTAATTREICLAANTNITAIHYHFKNKAGLYRAIFSEPQQKMPFPALQIANYQDRSLADVFCEFYRQLLRPFVRNGHQPPRIFHLIHELVNREQVEPTGLVDDLLILPAQNIHDPLNAILCHYLQLEAPDKELHRLAFTIVGMGFSLVHPRHIVKHYAPELISDEMWEQQMYSRLAFFAEALVKAELALRKDTTGFNSDSQHN